MVREKPQSGTAAPRGEDAVGHLLGTALFISKPDAGYQPKDATEVPVVELRFFPRVNALRMGASFQAFSAFLNG